MLEVDDIFRNAFLFAMYQHRETNPNDVHHGLDFPIPQSLFVSNLILPFLPTFTEEDTNALQIKKTSWKSAKKFIKALEKERLLKSKDRNGGETVIQDVDFGDPAISTFKPYGLPRKNTAAPESGSNSGCSGGGERAATSATSINDESVGQQLKKLSLLKPKEKLAPVFNSVDSNPHSFYLPTELRSIIIAYIESENLVSATNKRLINLNPILANAVFDGQSSMDREVLVKGTVPQDALYVLLKSSLTRLKPTSHSIITEFLELLDVLTRPLAYVQIHSHKETANSRCFVRMERIILNCAHYWAILRNNETRDQVKPKAGPAPTIRILLETRSGNKTVSKVSGMEAFYVNTQLLADELQKACASSTSINQLVGGKVGAMEIMIQGPQKDIITKALEKRGVSRSWIEVLDKTKAKKR